MLGYSRQPAAVFQVCSWQPSVSQRTIRDDLLKHRNSFSLRSRKRKLGGAAGRVVVATLRDEDVLDRKRLRDETVLMQIAHQRFERRAVRLDAVRPGSSRKRRLVSSQYAGKAASSHVGRPRELFACVTGGGSKSPQRFRHALTVLFLALKEIDAGSPAEYPWFDPELAAMRLGSLAAPSLTIGDCNLGPSLVLAADHAHFVSIHIAGVSSRCVRHGAGERKRA